MISLPQHIIDSINNNKTSIGDSPCLPPEEEEKFLVYLIEDTFDDLLSKLDGEYNSINSLKQELSRLLTTCKQKESQKKEELENICCDVVFKLMDMKDVSDIVMEMRLVDKIDTSNERMYPEKTKDFSFEDISDMKQLTKEVYKRRVLDALVAGAATYYTYHLGDFIKEIFEIDSDLPSLYKKIIDINNVLMFTEKITLDNKSNVDAGKVDVMLDTVDDVPRINSEGLIFPVLVTETIKGVLELAISHGLPESIEKAKYVISKADFKLCELWDFRIGYSLWRIIADMVEELGYSMFGEVGVPYLLMSISQLDCDDFNETLQEVFAKTKKGKTMLQDIIEDLIYDKQSQPFEQFSKIMNSAFEDYSDDDYFTSEELTRQW